MKRILSDLKLHIKEDFDVRTYGLTTLLLIVLLGLNYGLEVETKVLSHLTGLEYMGFIGVVFFGSYYLSVLIKRGQSIFRNRSFMTQSALILLIATLGSSLYFLKDIKVGLEFYEWQYMRLLILNSIGSVVVIGGLALLYGLRDRKHLDSFYGLRRTSIKGIAPYFVLLLLMFPLIYWASLQPHFLDTYPMFRAEYLEPVFGLSIKQMAAIFETVYLLDFIRVELLFRGALILGLARFLGKDTVLTMAVIYCILHINKPMGEAISSVFGGYILGVISLHQRHILGGCIVHIGVAGMMELLAYWAAS